MHKIRTTLFVGITCMLFGVWISGCVPPGRCHTSDDCPSSQKCVAAQCLQCIADTDCGANGRCVGFKCASGATPEPSARREAKGPDAQGGEATFQPDGGPPSERSANQGPDAEEAAAPDETPKDCEPGQRRPCYTGPQDKANVGNCKEGTQTCDDKGTWGTCTGDIQPAAKEVCGDEQDNNCNGDVDEGCTCTPGDKRACGSAIGTCQKGEQVCSQEAQWGSCQGAIQPQTESCDGKDNNCDGSIDEIFTRLGQSCNVGTGACQRTGKIVCAADGNRTECSVKAGSPEKESCDGKDNDCNGKVDEGLTRECYSGPEGTKSKGTCRAGTQTCTKGTWSACSGEVLPAKDDANCDSKDNDCDGPIDEDCACKPGDKQKCGSDIGECTKGEQTCSQAGQWGECSGQTSPSPEICDGKDNDCDGSLDETFATLGQSCNVGTGECRRSGKIICNSDKTGTKCSATAGSPTTELCDGKDNDCDGSIDETFSDLGKTCSIGTGECRSSGKFVCNDTKTKTRCDAPTISPKAETCNGKDDDCDGKTDETFTKLGDGCTVGTGACRRSGTTICNASGSGTKCSATAGNPTTEICDGIDNDCDGNIDDGVSNCCTPGERRACPGGTNTGECTAGTQTCSSSRNWSACSGQTNPKTETCNGKDDDCDGKTDENNPGGGGSCTTNKPGVCSPGTKLCSGGSLTCQQNTASSTEKCDGKDNDCDGSTDENWSNKGKTCHVGTGECRRSATYVCKADGSGLSCPASAGSPKTETCNGKDDDCDGTVDDGNPGGGQNCDVANQQGECKNGKTKCQNGTLICQQVVSSTTETCNGKDDDCDGTIDDGNPGGGAWCDPGDGCDGTTRCVNGQIICRPLLHSCCLKDPQLCP